MSQASGLTEGNNWGSYLGRDASAYRAAEKTKGEMRPQFPRARGKVSIKQDLSSQTGHPPESKSELLDLIRLQLTAEADLKQSLEARAMTIIATSGAFVTLLLGIATWIFPHSIMIPLAAKSLVVSGVLLLVVAAIGGIAVNAPSLMGKIDADHLLALLEMSPEKVFPVSLREITVAQTKVLVSAQIQNRRKAKLLTGSVRAQVLGISLIASAILVILL
jgi:hypothetical protein